MTVVEKSTPQSTPKSTVNVNVKTTLLKQIRKLNPEFAEMPSTWIVDVALRQWIVESVIKTVAETPKQ